MRDVLHYVSLDGLGGVELQFADFIVRANAQAETQHSFVACGRQIHPNLRARETFMAACLGREKYAAGVKLPSWPRGLRRARQRGAVVRSRPDVVVIWNRMRDSLDTLAAAGDQRCLYWERGSAWFAGDTAAKREFLRRVPAALCNSHAARRMLELRWNYRGQLQICRNALRPSLVPERVPVRQLPVRRRIRLGMAARLVPLKGTALTLHALAELRRDGRDVELVIAGDGPERARLEQLAHRLGLGDRVVFRGLVADMGAFYRDIDCLLHPALREPFGQITLEAAAYGCPSVVAGVDGLPETIVDRRTGRVVPVSLPVSDYAGLGGGDSDIPPLVYHPDRDCLDVPMLADPERLAAAVVDIIEDASTYAAMSHAAVEQVRTNFDFTTHVDTALEAMQTLAASAAARGGII